MQEDGVTVEDVDALTGPIVGVRRLERSGYLILLASMYLDWLQRIFIKMFPMMNSAMFSTAGFSGRDAESQMVRK